MSGLGPKPFGTFSFFSPILHGQYQLFYKLFPVKEYKMRSNVVRNSIIISRISLFQRMEGDVLLYTKSKLKRVKTSVVKKNISVAKPHTSESVIEP